MSKTIQLSTQEERIICYLVTYIEDNQFAPSVREIGKELSIPSTSCVVKYLNKLESLNILKRRPNTPRAISLNWDMIDEREDSNE